MNSTFGVHAVSRPTAYVHARCVPLLLLTDNRHPITSSFGVQRPSRSILALGLLPMQGSSALLLSLTIDKKTLTSNAAYPHAHSNTLLPQTQLSVDNDSCHHPTTSWTAMIVAFCPPVGALLDFPMMAATDVAIAPMFCLGKSCLSGGRDVVWTGLCGR